MGYAPRPITTIGLVSAVPAGTPITGRPSRKSVHGAEETGMGLAAIVTVLADTADSIRSFVGAFIFVYVLLILAYILTSWIRLPYSPWLNRIQRFLYDVCEPYLRIFRRFVPAIGPLDLSPMVGVIVLLLIQSLVDSVLARL
jgi:uncharacterized protein YggT (Ycf19 family)